MLTVFELYKCRVVHKFLLLASINSSPIDELGRSSARRRYP